MSEQLRCIQWPEYCEQPPIRALLSGKRPCRVGEILHTRFRQNTTDRKRQQKIGGEKGGAKNGLKNVIGWLRLATGVPRLSLAKNMCLKDFEKIRL